MAWYDTIIEGANALGNVYNAAKPLINTGAAIYDRNKTRNSIGQAFDQYSGYADRSLNTLGDIYNEGKAATLPYREAGNQGITGYTNLLNNPSSITENPGYQFRFDQGAEALRRNQAATGYRGSGNQQIALQEYGQNMATSEFDNALSRYLPMVNTGLSSTNVLANMGANYASGVGQINRGLGEAAAGGTIGGAAASSDMLSDILGYGAGNSGGEGNPISSVADTLKTGKDLWDTGKKVYDFFGNGSAGSQNALGTIYDGVGSDAAIGSMATTPLSASYAAGQGAAALGTGGFASGVGASVGAGGAASGMGASAITPAANSFWAAAPDALYGNALASGAGTAAGGAGGAAAGSIGLGQALGFSGLGLAALKAISGSGTGGPNTKVAKISKDANPQAVIDRLLAGDAWVSQQAGANIQEPDNIHVVGKLIENGVLNYNDPRVQNYMDIWDQSEQARQAMQAWNPDAPEFKSAREIAVEQGWGLGLSPDKLKEYQRLKKDVSGLAGDGNDKEILRRYNQFLVENKISG